jgi:hypothetical protein
MTQIMGAVVGVLNESLTESLKGFYKMRKAYMTLDGILKMEEKYLQIQPPTRSQTAPANLTSLGSKTAAEKSTLSSAASSVKSATKPNRDLAKRVSDLKMTEESMEAPASSGASKLLINDVLDDDADSEGSSSSIDSFIHSGANLCFGMLLLILAMIPPTFSRLLAIIGFRGDKERGLQMLWQASKFHNLIGAIASLGLLGFYNGFVRYCEIMPDATNEDEAQVEGYPMDRLAVLLTKMRTRYPKSQLWVLEEARMKGAKRNLEGALALLEGSDKSPLKQVEALRTFERSMNAMYLHKYEKCAHSFLDVSTCVFHPDKTSNLAHFASTVC